MKQIAITLAITLASITLAGCNSSAEDDSTAANTNTSVGATTPAPTPTPTPAPAPPNTTTPAVEVSPMPATNGTNGTTNDAGNPPMASTPTGVPATPNKNEGSPNVPAVQDEDSSFYFSYDESSSTAAYDLTKYYIENGLTPNENWGRAYEYLNSENFEHFNAKEVGPFEISMGLMSTESHFIPLTQPVEALNLLSLGVNISGPTLTKEQRPNIVATFLVDISGSMSSRYATETADSIASLLDVTKYGLNTLVESLKAGDVINLVTFESQAHVLLENWSYSESGLPTYTNFVDSLATKGSTNLNAGIERAYEVAQRTFDSNKSNRVIILTDAHANTGQVDATIIANNTVHNELEGIYFSGVGIGQGFDDRFLNELTDIGRGNYFGMITPNDAKRIFQDQFTSFLDAAVKNVRFQLTYPNELNHLVLESAAEESSTDKEDIQPTLFSFNSQQFFLERFSTDTLALEQTITLGIEYDDENGNQTSSEHTLSLEELMSSGQIQIKSATLISILANLIAGQIQCTDTLSSPLLSESIDHALFIKYKDLIEQYCRL